MRSPLVRGALCGLLLAGVTAGGVLPGVPAVAQAKKSKKSKKDKKDKKDKKPKVSKKAKKRAKRMARVGKAAYKKGKFDDAVLAFTGAYEADGNPKWLYNVARCHEKAGRPFKAMEFYGQYLTEFPDAKDREEVETVAGFLKLKLEKTFAHLTVTSTPEGADVQIGEGDKAVDAETPWVGWLEPGRYALAVTAEGMAPFNKKLKLKAGDKEVIEVTLKPPPPPAPEGDARQGGGPEPEPEPPPPVAEEEKPGPDQRAEAASPDAVPAPPPEDAGGIGTPAMISLVVAGVALAGFVAFGAMASSKEGELADGKGDLSKDSADLQAAADSANSLGMAANISLGLSVAAGATGGILAWTW